jgi:ankyrin repeat protein
MNVLGKAAKVGDLVLLQELLQRPEYTVHTLDVIGCNALSWAAGGGHVACVAYLLKEGSNVNSASSSGGWTSLHNSSMYGFADVTRMLLDTGAVVDTPHNTCGWTALYWAIRNNHPNVARVLIDYGAKISNVVLESDRPIPNWVQEIVASRNRCCCAAVLLIAIHKFHHTKLMGRNDINVIKMVAKHIWSTRFHESWNE